MGGHYYVYSRVCGRKVRTKAELLNDSRFIELNDAKVKSITLETMLSCVDGTKSAYILAYVPLTEYISEDNSREQLNVLL